MSKKKPKLPLESYDPRLLLLLEKGCKEEVRVPCESRGAAIRLRQEINNMRRAMLDAHRTNAEMLYQAALYITKDEPTVITIKPRFAALEKALDAAGVPKIPAPDDGYKPTLVNDQEDRDKKTIEDMFFEDLKNLRN